MLEKKLTRRAVDESYRRAGDGPLVLQPQPSDDPNDPLVRRMSITYIWIADR